MNEFVEIRWKEFEKLGERAVRQNLATHIYGEENVRFAREWLESKRLDQEAALRDATLASQAEANAIARDAASEASRAADAASRTAEAAESANKRATIAIVISIISAIATISIAIYGLLSVAKHVS
ncbi:hypothetical protein LGH82_28740 [Mesorhizobium sp. PAMC28654]|uniref:hypothetical protein n=1 Tax=Mesorhizobium sp. PAMC28654 TaxID=2880934 RepID=UPI001D0BCB61|nr:hypothetical protein [Mesorhizobium sp. PAMC28654]UDL88332.1 hypothetical protein LGH82_24815 [Mesorhizobium sp. PAMC28654]UDL89033.1 hypothetical protein LGH82_28740 [Mesorhizobium sp. PAMC28654]